MSHPLIIGNLRPNTRIYRVFPRIRFFELFEQETNTLVQPKLWNDPFENLFLQPAVKPLNGDTASFRFHDAVYGQCWTLESRSDALWQIYSKQCDGIRVRTTVGMLIDSLRAANRDVADQNCIIGRVSYERDKQLRAFARSMFVNHERTEAIARSQLLKRRAFRQENEVRLLYISSRKTREKDRIYRYPLNPLAIFDQVMVDGRVSSKEYAPLKEAIAKRTGFPKRRIKRSLLYTLPNNFVVRIP